jgi:hypothetical protein
MEGINTLLNLARQNGLVIKKKYKKSDLRQLINDFLPKSFEELYGVLLNKVFQEKKMPFKGATELCLQNLYGSRHTMILPFWVDLDMDPYSRNFAPIGMRREAHELTLKFKQFELRFENKYHCFTILDTFNRIPFFSEKYIVNHFEKFFFPELLIKIFEKKPIKLKCEICNRVEGNKFITKYFYDENRALEIELNGITKIHECKLEAVNHREPSIYWKNATYIRNMCEICINRIQITDTSYLYKPSYRKDIRFIRKNELITDDFVAIESVNIIDRNIHFHAGNSFMLGRGTGKTPNWFEESEGLNSRGFSTFYDECNNQPIHSKRKLT